MKIKKIGIIIVLVLGFPGCQGSDISSKKTESTERLVQQVAWDTMLHIVSSEEDTTLQIPRLYVANDEGSIYVFDFGNDHLKSFDRNGDFLWSFGGKGQGPSEFLGVIDMELGSDNNIWVFDARNNRITIVSENGEVIDMITLSGEHLIRDILPMSEDYFLGTTYTSTDQFLIEFDTLGVPAASHAPPDQNLKEAYYTTRQTYTIMGEDSKSWLALFPFGDLFLIYDDTEIRCKGSLIEGAPFPKTMPEGRPDVWAVAGALGDSLVYVLPKGETKYALQVLDLYSAQDCKYKNSVTLPGEFNTFYMKTNVFYFESENPAPRILGLSPAVGELLLEKGAAE